MEKDMFSTFAAGTFAGLWIMAGTAMIISFKND